jgi:gentisate 1,2-dioxygenase
MSDATRARELSLAGDDAAARATAGDFYDAMARANVAPLWDRYNTLAPPEPMAPDKGCHWPWTTMLPLLARAAREISMEDAERRVVMLLNPSQRPGISTTGLYGALQVLLPGETARPHRHVSASFRFVMSGEGAVTNVEGKPCAMNEGDLILTPSWTWHEHANPGKEQVIWFNGLDLPLTLFYNAEFHEHGAGGNHPPDRPTMPDESFAHSGLINAAAAPTTPYSPLFRYRWTDVVAALATIPREADGIRRLRYVNPLTGGAAMPTMDLYLLDLPKGQETRTYRTTSNAICVVVEGEGVTHISDNVIAWRKGDVFTLPHWSWISHKAASDPAQIFQSTDRELLRNLHYLRDEFA